MFAHAACSSVRTVIDNMAPEVLGAFSDRDELRVSPKIDVWGAGCFLYYLLTKVPMWGALSAWPEEPRSDDTSIIDSDDEEVDLETDSAHDDEEVDSESDLAHDDIEDCSTDVSDAGITALQADQSASEEVDLEDDLGCGYYEDSCSGDSDMVLMSTVAWQHRFWVNLLQTTI